MDLASTRLFDPADLQLGDGRDHLGAERVVGDRDQAAEQRRREHLQHRIAQRLGDALGLGHQVGIGAHVHDQLGPDIRSQQDQGVAEVDLPPLAILHDALVEDLEKDLVHVGMGLLDLIQQHHGVGLAAHCLGQDPALAIADIARRRPFERADRMGLLILGHVDGDDILLAAIEDLGQRQRGLGLADARGAGEHEDTDRLVGIVEAGAVRLDPPRDHLHGVVLADDALVEVAGEVQHRLDLVLHHAADGDARPICDDAAHGNLVHDGQDQRSIVLECIQRGHLGRQLGRNGAALLLGQPSGLASASSPSTEAPPWRSLARRSRISATMPFSCSHRASSPSKRAFSAAKSALTSASRSARS